MTWFMVVCASAAIGSALAMAAIGDRRSTIFGFATIWGVLFMAFMALLFMGTERL